MKRLLLLAVAGVLVSAITALGQDVRYNFDKNTDFSKLKTYKWVTLKDAVPVNDLVNKQIMDTVDAELAAKGLTRVDDDSASLYIGYQAGVSQEKEFTSFNTGWGYGAGWYRGGWYGYPGGMTTGTTSTIFIGQLALDLYDSANHTLVWRSLVSKTIDQNAKPDKQQKNLAKAVRKMLKNYPPGATK